MKRWVLTAAASALALSACAAVVPTLDTAHLAWATERWPGVTPHELETGRSLYVTRCSSCHTAPAPADVVAQGSEEMIRDMAERAHLTAEELEQVVRFVEASTAKLPPAVASRPHTSASR
jgi:hypothetical protein